ncbi:hypothetical protein [Chondromyces crocatus]|uniref:Secreted protein n=1 Tax=Chondromyces crocatus TaxID=52 RepID=A0A0K1EM47_CHOCO|nr:hypothetical protein [Chondromyces crocatus]AKT41939.1 uncharacterized protein CMC5_061610 [Chondromyces crocatus]
MQHRRFGLLGMGVLFTTAVAMGVVGCQAEGSSSGPSGPGGTGGSGASTTSTSGDGGSAPGVGGSTNVGGGGEGGEGGGTAADPPDASIPDINTGAIPSGAKVTVRGAVAMSSKYLVSRGSSGSCLWGVYLSAPGLTEVAPHTGIIALSYGTNATTGSNGQLYCPILGQVPAGDSFPDDVAPGDVLDVVGEASSFLLNQCSQQAPENNPSQIPQRQLAKVSKVTVTGSAPVPTAKLLTGADVAKLVSPTDAAFHGQWAGAKVRIEGVSRVDANAPDDYLYVSLGQGVPRLEIARNVWYRAQSSDACRSRTSFPVNHSFDHLEGFSSIDFCSWKLLPGDKCADYAPRDVSCGAVTDCTPD